MSSPHPAIRLTHHDLAQHASITVKIHGNETSWVADVGGDDPSTAVVSLRCKQLELVGRLGDLEAVLGDWTSLLAELRRRLLEWDAVPPRARRLDPSWRPTGPHPFQIERSENESHTK